MKIITIKPNPDFITNYSIKKDTIDVSNCECNRGSAGMLNNDVYWLSDDLIAFTKTAFFKNESNAYETQIQKLCLYSLSKFKFENLSEEKETLLIDELKNSKKERIQSNLKKKSAGKEIATAVFQILANDTDSDDWGYYGWLKNDDKTIQIDFDSHGHRDKNGKITGSIVFDCKDLGYNAKFNEYVSIYNNQVSRDGIYITANNKIYNIKDSKQIEIYTHENDAGMVSLINPNWSKILFIYHPKKSAFAVEYRKLVIEYADIIPKSE
jgi:hypothetical protein